MKEKTNAGFLALYKDKRLRFSAIFLFTLFILAFVFPHLTSLGGVTYEKGISYEDSTKAIKKPPTPPVDKAEYDRLMAIMANNPLPEPREPLPDGTIPPPPPPLWPVQDSPYPSDSRAILPFNRIIAYYGNLYSRKMGVLGEYDEHIMLPMLLEEVEKWEVADPEIPPIPALHYIAVVAQASAGADGKYRARMPHTEIDKVLIMAEKIGAIVFLDIQVGFSTVEQEIPLLEKYLKMPNVHLGLDPEFSMKGSHRPGKAVGTMDASDINFTSRYLANLVKEYNLPPKVLVVHRYTQNMLTNYQNIALLPEVQMVIHMDGWGAKARKKNTYRSFVVKEPVQFTGFKIFYKNDLFEYDKTLLSPRELLDLNPRPLYIQYQ